MMYVEETAHESVLFSFRVVIESRIANNASVPFMPRLSQPQTIG